MKMRAGILLLMCLVGLTIVSLKHDDESTSTGLDRSRVETIIRSFETQREACMDSASPLSVLARKDLLIQRREAMKWLIRNDPEEALRRTLTYAERAGVPDDWIDVVEERFSETVELQVFSACGQGREERHLLVKRADGTELSGLAWGILGTYQSKRRLPMAGIALDGHVALFESGVLPLSGADNLALTGNPGPVVQIGERFLPADDKVLIQASSLYHELATMPGPDTAEPLLRALSDPAKPIDPERIRKAALALSREWTTTPKTVLLLNTVYPDDSSQVGSADEWEAVMSDVSEWLRETSFGKVWLDVRVHPQLVTLPHNKAEYVGSQADAVVDAMAVAGVSEEDHDITIVVYPHNPGKWFGGLATIGGWRQEINGTIGRQLIAHEIGHNYGLLHSTSWDANNGRIMPEDADSFIGEYSYGDLFCIMGSGGFPEGHFNPFARNRLGWLDDEQVIDAVQPGVYRIFATDDTLLSSEKPIALRVRRELNSRPLSETFWIGFRSRKRSGSLSPPDGALVYWQHSESQTRLLDMTPDSLPDNAQKAEYRFSEDLADGALSIGNTFIDPQRMLYLTPLAKGMAEGRQYMDIRIAHLQAGNTAPFADVAFPAETPHARTSSIRLEAAFGDPDGDDLDVEWDFGNGVIRKGASVDWVFLAGGSRVVTFRVQDGRGGITEERHTYEIQDKATEWTYHERPPVFATGLHDCLIFKGHYVGISGTHLLSSADGETWKIQHQTGGPAMKRLAASADRVVAVGWGGRLATSTDGENWELINFDETFDFQDVVYGHGQFLAVGTSVSFSAPELPPLYRSFDGISWEPVDVFAERRLTSVLPTENGFVAVPGNALSRSPAYLSHDGAIWTEAPPLADDHPIPSYLMGNSRMLIGITGLPGGYLVSSDGGRNWSLQDFGIREFAPHTGTFGRDLWFAAGEAPTGGIVALSQDGLRWDVVPETIPLGTNIAHLRVLNRQLWTLDESSFGRRSSPIPLQAESPGAFPFIPSSLIYPRGWMHSDWFGWWQTQDRRTAYHLEHGWIFFHSGNDAEGMWFYDIGLSAWTFTRAGIWPWIYITSGYSESDWLYYATGGRPGGRWFYSSTSQQWRQEGD